MSNPGAIDEDEDETLYDSNDPPTPDPEKERIAGMETEARRAGWRPLDEYRGPAGQWRTAEEFLRRGQDILPIVRKDLAKERERSSKMEEEIRTLRTGLDEQKLVMEDLLKMARNASEAGYRRAMDELKAQKRAAAQEGDIAKVVLIDEQISEVVAERAATPDPAERPKPAPAPTPVPKAAVDPVVEQFVSDNPWFNTDPVLHKAMEMEHILLLETAKGMSLEDNLAMAREAVMKRFPAKFGIKPKAVVEEDEEEDEEVVTRTPRRTSSVSAPTAPAGGGRRQLTGIASIEDPQERAVAKMAFDRAKRQMPDLQEAEWFSVYENPKIETDAMKSHRKVRKA